MEGVTTAVALFIFFCIGSPRLVRRRTQYYAAVVALLLILLLGCVDSLVASPNFNRFFNVMKYLLDFAAVLLLIMSTGGLTAGELLGEMGEAFSELRRGPAADKPVIVPLTGEQPRVRRERAVDAYDPPRHSIDPGPEDDAGGV